MIVCRGASPIPWYGCILVIVLGIVSLVIGACISIPGLGEVGRALIYIPLGSLFGLTMGK